jgi:hypothetical protein
LIKGGVIVAKELDIIIPVSMDKDWPTADELIHDIVEQYEQYGFRRFALNSPGGGWRSVGYPPKEHYISQANLFNEVQKAVKPLGIECGWWIGLTLKSGKTEGFQSVVKADGSEHPFSNCPQGKAFQQRFVSDIADFAAQAKPAFIILEDDYSMVTAFGCFCDEHMKRFNERHGYAFTREELAAVLEQRTPEALKINREWRELMKDGMVEISAAIRTALDERTPEIPVGYLQAWVADKEGDCTYEVAKALAGSNHTPFSRLFGASYGGIVSKEIPMMLFSMLHSKQRLPDDFGSYMEADTFPHTRFYSAGCQMLAAMAAVFSYGFDGALFIVRQLLDGANEETAYGKGYAKERARFEALHQTVKDCTLKGVSIPYDTFYNTLDDRNPTPWWVQPVARFGIPYVTTDAEVVFLDDRLARFADDAFIQKALSKVLFIDSAAAKVLCERGYGEYIGVEIGEDIKQGKLQWDLATREVIVDEYAPLPNRRNMTAPWMLAPQGNGVLPKITVTDPRCRVVTELYNFEHKLLTPAMTVLDNTLGGRVVMMGLSVEHNGSQALFNYRRKHLLQQLLIESCDAYCLVKQAPDVYVIENVANDAKADFREVLTIINLCADELDEVVLHLPPSLRSTKRIEWLDRDGEWKSVAFTATADGVIVQQPLAYCKPLYLKIY